MSTPIRPRPNTYDKQVGLVLQGGGALGSYQAGVYEALATSDYVPDWVAGISIGAINAALIAGNAPENRVARLREFWEGITQRPAFWPPGLEEMARFWTGSHRGLGAMTAMTLGQPGFFGPRPPLDWMSTTGPISLYDTVALRSTLERLVDFDRINARETRLSVGAVNLRTGLLTYFDNANMRLGAEHVMASGALPPGFPAVEIEGEAYWDGGLVSNTPLQHVIEALPRRSRLIFQVDVFPARGELPADLNAVQERDKDIRYSSRTRAVTERMRETHDVRHNINALWDRLPKALRETPEGRFLYAYGCVTTMDIVQIIHRAEAPQGAPKDYEFSRHTMHERWSQGCSDGVATLAASPWLAPMPPEVGARTFDVLDPAPVPTAA